MAEHRELVGSDFSIRPRLLAASPTREWEPGWDPALDPRRDPRRLLFLQAHGGNQAVVQLIAGPQAGTVGLGPSVLPVVQRLPAHQTFKRSLQELIEVLGETSDLGAYLKQNKNKNAKPSKNTELNALFKAAWDGDENAESQQDDDRRMMEKLILSGHRGIGEAVRNARLKADDEGQFGAGPSGARPDIVSAFTQALFFRAERKDSNGVANGYLNFDGTKHGRMGSARDYPGRRGEGVRDRADQYLFVSKEGKEVRAYQQKGQGGDREVLTIVSSRDEVQAMVYDVDSRGYKTKGPLTGIVAQAMTPKAIDNLNTWLAVEERNAGVLDPILQNLIH